MEEIAIVGFNEGQSVKSPFVRPLQGHIFNLDYFSIDLFDKPHQPSRQSQINLAHSNANPVSVLIRR